ncbi:hypothetical protein [Serinibacter salmoneus]|nr:hypothetical protein [Serinibacter salmoneus]
MPMVVRVAEAGENAGRGERLDVGALVYVVGEALRRTRRRGPLDFHPPREAIGRLATTPYEACRETEAMAQQGARPLVVEVRAVRSGTPDPQEDLVPEITISLPSGRPAMRPVLDALSRELRYFDVRVDPGASGAGEDRSAVEDGEVVQDGEAVDAGVPPAMDCCAGAAGSCTCACGATLADLCIEVRADLYLDRLDGRVHRGAGRVVSALERALSLAVEGSLARCGNAPVAWSQPVWSTRELCEVVEVEPADQALREWVEDLVRIPHGMLAGEDLGDALALEAECDGEARRVELDFPLTVLEYAEAVARHFSGLRVDVGEGDRLSQMD